MKTRLAQVYSWNVKHRHTHTHAHVCTHKHLQAPMQFIDFICNCHYSVAVTAVVTDIAVVTTAVNVAITITAAVTVTATVAVTAVVTMTVDMATAVTVTTGGSSSKDGSWSSDASYDSRSVEGGGWGGAGGLLLTGAVTCGGLGIVLAAVVVWLRRRE